MLSFSLGIIVCFASFREQEHGICNMRHDNRSDGYGCNNGVCVPECRYSSKEERIEDEEVLTWYEKRRINS
jgi:hypothetical protein